MGIPTSDMVIAIASAVTAVATISIALATWLSLKILAWHKIKDRRDRQPILVLIDEITDDQRSLFAKNIGRGPALNIVRTILETGPSLTCTTYESFPLQPLGEGQKIYAFCASGPGMTSSAISDDPALHVRVEYDDILGNHYVTRLKNREHTIKRIPKRKTPPEEAEII